MAALKKRDVGKLDEVHALALLEACNDAIGCLDNMLKEQNRQKRLLKQRIRALQRQRSPLNRMPDELMLEIFKQTTYGDIIALGSLINVCRNWYRLAINSPPLWAAISLDFRSTPQDMEIQRRTKYMESAICYSKEALLDVDLALPQETDLVEMMVFKLQGSEL
jgi:hypothetical protein